MKPRWAGLNAINDKNIEVIKRTSDQSITSNLPFPEVLKRLGEAQVESYFTDLCQREKTYYASSGEAIVTQMNTEPLGVVAEQFDGPAVKLAISDIQQRKTGYVDFLKRIVAAGTFAYTVRLRGKRAIYLGRTGDLHIEHFPVNGQS